MIKLKEIKTLNGGDENRKRKNFKIFDIEINRNIPVWKRFKDEKEAEEFALKHNSDVIILEPSKDFKVRFLDTKVCISNHFWEKHNMTENGWKFYRAEIDMSKINGTEKGIKIKLFVQFVEKKKSRMFKGTSKKIKSINFVKVAKEADLTDNLTLKNTNLSKLVSEENNLTLLEVVNYEKNDAKSGVHTPNVNLFNNI